MDDKKKLMVLGAMGVVLLGIGAFQFAKGSGAAPAPAPTPAVTQSTDSNANANDNGDVKVAPQQNDLVSGSYAYRDPFKPLVDPNPAPPQMAPPPRVASNAGGGTFPPFPIDKGDALPGAGGGTTVPLTPPAPQYGYRLAGVIMGRRPAAVFVDAQNVQHLVQVGGSLDGDTRLVSLDRDHVVINVKGETKNLTLGGGDSSAK